MLRNVFMSLTLASAVQAARDGCQSHQECEMRAHGFKIMCCQNVGRKFGPSGQCVTQDEFNFYKCTLQTPDLRPVRETTDPDPEAEPTSAFTSARSIASTEHVPFAEPELDAEPERGFLSARSGASTGSGPTIPEPESEGNPATPPSSPEHEPAAPHIPSQASTPTQDCPSGRFLELTAYHGTTTEGADQIEYSQEMRPGRTNMIGKAVYTDSSLATALQYANPVLLELHLRVCQDRAFDGRDPATWDLMLDARLHGRRAPDLWDKTLQGKYDFAMVRPAGEVAAANRTAADAVWGLINPVSARSVAAGGIFSRIVRHTRADYPRVGKVEDWNEVVLPANDAAVVAAATEIQVLNEKKNEKLRNSDCTAHSSKCTVA